MPSQMYWWYTHTWGAHPKMLLKRQKRKKVIVESRIRKLAKRLIEIRKRLDAKDDSMNQ